MAFKARLSGCEHELNVERGETIHWLSPGGIPTLRSLWEENLEKETKKEGSVKLKDKQKMSFKKQVKKDHQLGASNQLMGQLRWMGLAIELRS